MKKLLILIALAACLVAPAYAQQIVTPEMPPLYSISALAPYATAATLTFVWDAMPGGESWTLVRIYERTGAAPNYVYIKVAEVAPPLTTATITGVSLGPHAYVARSYNGSWESADSVAVAIPALPIVPTGFKVTITIVITPGG